jgi:hypothetical protein
MYMNTAYNDILTYNVIVKVLSFSTCVLCSSLIANHPDVADYLRGKGVAAGSPEAKAFLLRLFNQIDVAVNLIDEPATLRAYLTAIKKLQYSDAKSGFFKVWCCLQYSNNN